MFTLAFLGFPMIQKNPREKIFTTLVEFIGVYFKVGNFSHEFAANIVAITPAH